MNFLVVSEVFRGGGVETQVVGQVEAMVPHGHSFFVATGSPRSALAEQTFSGGLFDLALGRNASAKDLRSSIARLESYVIAQDIDVIHGHPMYSLIAAGVLANRTGRPLVVTIHGPASLNNVDLPGAKSIVTEYVLPSASMVYCVSEEVAALVAKESSCRMRVLPNSVRVRHERSRREVRNGEWAWVGRLDHDKLPGLLDFIAKVVDRPPQVLRVIGDGAARVDLENYLRANRRAAAFVEVAGWHADPSEMFASCELVAGMGRVMLEAAADGVPCLLVGYDGVKGLLDERLIALAARTNFSGRDLPTVAADVFISEIERLRSGSGVNDLRSWVAENRDAKNVWSIFEADARRRYVSESGLLRTLERALEESDGSPGSVWSDTALASLAGSSPDRRGEAGVSRCETRPAIGQRGVAPGGVEARGSEDSNPSPQAQSDLKRTADGVRVAALEQELNKAILREAEATALRDAMEVRLRTIEGSITWRATAPLRALLRSIRAHVESVLASRRASGTR